MITYSLIDTLPLKLMLLIKKHQFSSEKLMMKTRNFLGKYINKLKLGGDTKKRDIMILKGLPNRTTTHLNIVGAFVKTRLTAV